MKIWDTLFNEAMSEDDEIFEGCDDIFDEDDDDIFEDDDLFEDDDEFLSSDEFIGNDEDSAPQAPRFNLEELLAKFNAENNVEKCRRFWVEGFIF